MHSMVVRGLHATLSPHPNCVEEGEGKKTEEPEDKDWADEGSGEGVCREGGQPPWAVSTAHR
jgi:hypothetical protein